MHKDMDIKAKIMDFGAFNNWKGFIGLYFTKKELREIAKLCGLKAKDVENYTIKEIGLMIH